MGKVVSKVSTWVGKGITWVGKGITWVVKATVKAVGWIGKNTVGRLYQFGNWIYDKCVPPKIVKDLRAAKGKNQLILELDIRTTWIGNVYTSPWSRIGSLATCVLNGMLIKHWWIVAKARDSSCGLLGQSVCSNHQNIYYHFGFNKENGLKGAVRFGRYTTYQGADQFGRKSGGNVEENPDTYKHKKIQTPIENAVYFAEKFDGRYDLAVNNCQTFAGELYDSL